MLLSDTEQVGLPPEESLRRHVLAPLATAESVLDREYEEVAAERPAFDQFKRPVAGIETVSDAAAIPATRRLRGETRWRATERIRSAYRETVVSADHYDEVYGESLVVHVGRNCRRMLLQDCDVVLTCSSPPLRANAPGYGSDRN